MKQFDVRKYAYVKDKHDNVYKNLNKKGHYLKITPWIDGEDRRINVFEIESLVKSGKLTAIERTDALCAANKRWHTDERSWEFNGQTFCVEAIDGKDTEKALKAPMHTFVTKYKGADGKDHSFDRRYRIGMLKGDMVWWEGTGNFPQVCVYRFISIDEEPKFDNGFCYVNARHIKPIMNKYTRKYI